eukprot:3840109-Pyramimonas_sp.AAC.1
MPQVLVVERVREWENQKDASGIANAQSGESLDPGSEGLAAAVLADEGGTDFVWVELGGVEGTDGQDQ